MPLARHLLQFVSKFTKKYNIRRSSQDDLVDYLEHFDIITHPQVSQAMRKVDRKHFVANPEDAYVDLPYQTVGDHLAPPAYYVAQLLEVLRKHLMPGATALDIGSNSGYLAACMAEMVAPNGQVVAYEHLPEVREFTRSCLEKGAADLLKQGRLKLHEGHDLQGALAAMDGGYDAIQVFAHVRKVPRRILHAVKPGGRMLIPLGPAAEYLRLMQVDRTHPATLAIDVHAKAVHARKLMNVSIRPGYISGLWPGSERIGFYTHNEVGISESEQLPVMITPGQRRDESLEFLAEPAAAQFPDWMK